MKTFAKRSTAILIALLMIALMAFPAYATVSSNTTTATNKNSGSFTITLKNSEANHVFRAYRIFDGALSTENVLSDVSWAEGFNTTGIAKDLKDAGLDPDINGDESEILDFSKAEDVVRALETLADDDAKLIAVADVFFKHKGTQAAITETFTAAKTYELKPLTAGYYLVTDEYKNAATDGAATLSRNILAVTADVSAEVKNDNPDIDKKILDGANTVDSNVTGIGDTVAFQITGKVPNYTGYTNYFYVINDTLSNGLTFDGKNSIVVTVDGNKLRESTDYVVYTAVDGYTFRIAFKNIKSFDIGKDIKVTYSATVNQNAVIGNAGNPNTASLTYSNNPNDSKKGNPAENPKPDNDVPTGKSTDKKTKTYVTELDITKYADSIAAGKELNGAEFVLTGTYEVTTVKTATEYVEDTNGIYYKLTAGTYTTTKPHDDILNADGTTAVASNKSSYEAPIKTYSPKEATEYVKTTKEVTLTGTTANGGKLVFKGLGKGSFTLKEIKAPAGYSLAPNVSFTTDIDLPAKIETGEETAAWKIDSNAQVSVDGTGVYKTDVIDRSGSTLPSTGGRGRIIFYVIGGSLIALSAVLLVAKKRMSAR